MTLIFLICLVTTFIWIENTVAGWIAAARTGEDDRNIKGTIVLASMMILFWSLFYYLSVHHHKYI